MERKTFLTRLGRVFTFASFASFLPARLWAGSAQSRLKDPIELKQFAEVSDNLRCVCGKNMPISYINDLGNCIAWPMRSIIDGLIKEDYTTEQILAGFQSGFDEELVNFHPAFSMARKLPYSEFLPSGLKAGYGKKILAESATTDPAIYAGIVGGAMILAAVAFLKKRQRALDHSSPKIADEIGNEYMNRLYNDAN